LWNLEISIVGRQFLRPDYDKLNNRRIDMALYILGLVGLLTLLVVSVLFVAAVRHGDETLSDALSKFALASSVATVCIFALMRSLAGIWPEALSLSPTGILTSTIPAAMLIGLWIVARTAPYQ
jgi:hypothetical protein